MLLTILLNIRIYRKLILISMIKVLKTKISYAAISATLQQTLIIDVRYYKGNPTNYFSPFFTWGDVPVRYSEPDTAMSVASMIEGLRITSDCGENKVELFGSKSYKQLIDNADDKSTLGFIRGVGGHIVFDYCQAHQYLLCPSYRWVLDYKLQKHVQYIRARQMHSDIIVLDYPELTSGLELFTGEISIGHLLKAYLEGTKPYEDVFEEKVVYLYFTNHKRIHGHKEIKWMAPKGIPKIPSNSQRQLSLAFE